MNTAEKATIATPVFEPEVVSPDEWSGDGDQICDDEDCSWHSGDGEEESDVQGPDVATLPDGKSSTSDQMRFEDKNTNSGH